jgi:hypothetical protein
MEKVIVSEHNIPGGRLLVDWSTNALCTEEFALWMNK